jgi:hypothetical protein
MARLEDVTRDTAVRGILSDGLVTVADVKWIGNAAIELTYKDSTGRLGNELGGGGWGHGPWYGGSGWGYRISVIGGWAAHESAIDSRQPNRTRTLLIAHSARPNPQRAHHDKHEIVIDYRS